MQHAEDVEEDVELVREPEEAVRLLPDQRVREQEDDAHHGVKHYAWEISIHVLEIQMALPKFGFYQ